MGGVREARIGKITQLVRGEIQNGDRLVRLRLLCTVTVVQQRRIASVRAQRDDRGKAVHRSDPSGRGRVQHLAGGQRDPARFGGVLGEK